MQDAILRDKQPLSYVGHCCEIKASIDKCVKNTNPPLNCSENIELHYEGYLHLPELGILILPPIVKYVDVHRFGNEENLEVPGLLHGVIGRDCANECSILDIIPGGKDSDLISHGYKEVNMRYVSGESVMFQCVIDTFMMNRNINKKRCKHNDVDADGINNSKVLIYSPEGIIWIILAKVKSSSSSCHLVSIRWPTDISTTKYSSQICKELFNDIFELLNHNGLDATRSSVSNVFTTFSNYHILDLLTTNSALPRKGKGVKLVKRRTKWRCYYLAAGRCENSKTKSKRVVSSWQYSQPQSGGKFVLNQAYLDKYYGVIKSTTMAKYNSALLAKEIGKILKVTIQQHAVESALDDIRTCKNMTTENQSLIKMLTSCNNFSIVAYPVAYHYDVFKVVDIHLKIRSVFNLILM